VIVLISGTYDEAKRHAALRGYDGGRWVHGFSRMRLRALNIIRVELVGTYYQCPGWQSLFTFAASRIVGLPMGAR